MKSIWALLFAVVVATASGQTPNFYMSPSGSDSNSGTIGSPWASPNHAMTCGQIIQAAAGSYSAANFYTGKWGTVSCPSANNVAWVSCATFDACKISTSSAQGVYVDKSFWGVTGFEVTASSTFGTCFLVQSAINHVIFANDVANGCTQGGFSMNHGDYMIEVGDIAYNTALGSSSCTSGFNIWEPAQSDSVAGTHMYVAGDYAWNNEEPNPCGGTAPTDGEGLIFDTFNNTTYTAQAVAQNNIFVSNGGRGIEANYTGAPHFYIVNNTTYGNNNQAGQDFPSGNGEIEVENDGVSESTGTITVTNNIAMTSQATTGGSAIYACVIQSSSDVTFATNWCYSAAGNTTLGSGFGSNTTGTNPAFTSTSIPGAPSCSSSANAAACAAGLISNFHPTASGSSAFGYQPISNTSVVNSLFPSWLCNGTSLITGFPSGIITPGCGAGGPPTLSSIAITGSTSVIAGNTDQLLATGTYSDSSTGNVTSASTWSSSNTGTCTVANTGLVTATFSAGTCNITAVDSGVTSSPTFSITVNPITLVSIALTGTNSLTVSGPTSSLTATGTYNNSTTANVTSGSTWSSSNTGVCTVAGGVVSAVAVGTCNITAVDATITSTPTFTVTVAAAGAGTVFNCPTFNGGASGACSVAPYYDNTNGFATTQQFWIRSNCQSSTTPSCLAGTDAAFVPAGATHNGFGMAYSIGKVNVQAFTDTFTFVPNGWNFSLVLQNDNTHSGYEGAAFTSGASCEAGFYQDDGTDPTPNYLFALDFDTSGYIGGSYSYSTVQMYEMHESPCQPNDGGTHYWGTTKISTSPVPMSSPVGSQYTTTGDTYSATVTYDGSTLTLNMYDVTASGSCPGASCFTHTWSNVSIPSVVGGTTAWLGFTSAVGSGSPQEPSQSSIYVDSWSYVVNTPTGTPTYTAWNAGSTYNNGTVSAASPIYSVAPGTFTSAQSVSLSSSTGSSNICYVLSATTPALYPQVDNNGGCTSGTPYSGAISVPSTSTLYAMAGTPWGTGPPSTLVAGTYKMITLSSIAISGSGSLTIGGSTSSLTATGTYSDSSTANVTSASTWSSSNNGVCTVAAGVVTPVSVGTCNITAVDSGVTSSPTFTVMVSSSTLVSIDLTGTQLLTAGQATSQLTATGTYSNSTTANVTSASTWASSNNAICTVSAGLVTPLTAGTCNITAVDSGVTSSPTFTVTVVAAPPPVPTSLTNVTITGGVTLQ